ncbi:hypothetical protein CYY_003264 [Polysphondylium violaceum]|uniref:FNIP repeat-containing protein n=1 Tax=Polysphondylium violaceum TaxID=133409 RepID=A0A8J4V0B5_9MYCE|nr:hypothetical protein CYY_003264 [Polysphondylium violaceum]
MIIFSYLLLLQKRRIKELITTRLCAWFYSKQHICIKTLTNKKMSDFHQIWKNKFLRKKISTFVLSHHGGGPIQITLDYLEKYYHLLANDIIDFYLYLREEDLKKFIQTKQENIYLFSKVKGICFSGYWRAKIPLPEDLLQGELPFKSVTFGPSFHGIYQAGFIPNGVESVFLKNEYPLDIVENFFPETITEVVADHSIAAGEIVVGALPESLTRLEIGEGYEGDINQGMIPQNLKILDLGASIFNDLPSDAIPDSLTQLGFCGICEEDYSFPPNLKSLTTRSLNFPLTINTFSNTLTSLDFHEILFEEPLSKGVLPKSLISLNLGNYDLYLSPGVFPESLKTLYLGAFCDPITPGLLPPSLTTLDLGKSDYEVHLDLLPPSLTYLAFPAIYTQQVMVGAIPHGVKTLYFNHSLDRPDLGTIPNSVTKLVFKDNFQSPLIPGIIPNSVQELKFKCSYYTEPLKAGVFPNSVKRLTLLLEDADESIIFPETIPSGIEYFKYTGDGDLKGLIPFGVKTLKVIRSKPINPGVIPSTVRNLSIDNALLSEIPPHVKDLTIGNIRSDLIVPETVEKLQIIYNSIDRITIPKSLPSYQYEGILIVNK